MQRWQLILRSTLFTVLLCTITFFYSFFSVCMFPFPLRYRHAVIMAWTRSMVWLLKKICKVNYVIEGLENIPKDRNGIVMSKHQSTWETFLLPTLFHQTAIILKRELLFVPFFGWGLATIAPIAIDRKKTASAMEQVISKGKKCLAEGRWILIFPEGTRIPYGTLGKYRLGGARLAVATGYPIQPVAHNAGRYWPKRGFIKKPGTIRLVIGPLIESQHKTPEALLQEVKTWIEETVKKIDAIQ